MCFLWGGVVTWLVFFWCKVCWRCELLWYVRYWYIYVMSGCVICVEIAPDCLLCGLSVPCCNCDWLGFFYFIRCVRGLFCSRYYLSHVRSIRLETADMYCGVSEISGEFCNYSGLWS